MLGPAVFLLEGLDHHGVLVNGVHLRVRRGSVEGYSKEGRGGIQATYVHLFAAKRTCLQLRELKGGN